MLSVTRFEREANTTNNLQYGKRLIGGDQSFFGVPGMAHI